MFDETRNKNRNNIYCRFHKIWTFDFFNHSRIVLVVLIERFRDVKTVRKHPRLKMIKRKCTDGGEALQNTLTGGVSIATGGKLPPSLGPAYLLSSRICGGNNNNNE